MSKVIFKDVKKVYPQGETAVDEFNLDIEDKEFIVLVGPSGCGKSTTLRMVAGLEEITSGDIYIGDNLVNNLLPKDRNVAMVFQNYALYPHMNVFENMAFALKLSKVPKKDIEQRVKHAAEILGISDLLQRKPKALSGGQRQRVAIGRAIVREPQVFLMDEPLSNLDAKLRNTMRAELIKLRKRIDTTFIYVTHDQTEAMTLGDRIIVMKDGFIQQIGTPQAVYNNPVNMFVAGFIGAPQMNFLDAVIDKIDDEYVIVLCGCSYKIPPQKQKFLDNKKQTPYDVKLGIRPEHIQIVDCDTPNSIKADISVSEMMGSEMYLHIIIDEDNIVIKQPVTELLDKKEVFMNNSQKSSEACLNFVIKSMYMHVFDWETEKNLFSMDDPAPQECTN